MRQWAPDEDISLSLRDRRVGSVERSRKEKRRKGPMAGPSKSLRRGVEQCRDTSETTFNRGSFVLGLVTWLCLLYSQRPCPSNLVEIEPHPYRPTTSKL